MHLLKAWLDAKKGKHQDYDNLVSKLLSGSEITYCDLDFVLLLLCLILLRPIIVYSCQDDYASALFLPYLLPQFECSFNPCMLLFSNGTFSALLCKPDKDRVPLVDQELKRLRIPFFGPKTGHELMKEYLRLSEYEFNGTKIPAARIVDIFGTKVIDNLHKTEIEDLYSKTFNPEFDDHTTVKTLVEHHHRKSFSDDGIQYHDYLIRRENENILP
uniref:Uncharacterized protein n=2 Tax=Ciona savignyi TaxID=51511 RepID=H2Z9Z7_CIOSA